MVATSTSTATIVEHNIPPARGWQDPSITHAWCIVFGTRALSWRALRHFVLCRLRALELNLGLFVGRVPSKDNIADDPSRERYCLLRRMGAIEVKPFLHPSFVKAQAWESLSVVMRRKDGETALPVLVRENGKPVECSTCGRLGHYHTQCLGASASLQELRAHLQGQLAAVR